ncbi:hypothetical protein Patl_2843 [Paraglaciecola sp. T6c]|uniref:tetratricopeptide repeat protein n=1 Tax=Pseudoalteromonas atlantica (strain T6c / ATCC BAA-1087) TaxID=3042615 RepID=UPI00005C71F4|nr:hypothetical protein [Paraglaciecola sp. T6c]ABG41353.1 hypothetical protein Patl_2843 [Paraglaciecola sp. T6c]
MVKSINNSVIGNALQARGRTQAVLLGLSLLACAASSTLACAEPTGDEVASLDGGSAHQAASLVLDAGVTSELHALQQRWAKVNYTFSGDEQINAFKVLVTQANELVQDQPENAGYWAWLGICQSTAAAAIGGTDALGLAKKAKLSFEKSLELDNDALDGVATFSLGTLYHKVPGWPLSFGSDKQAKKLLIKAIERHPASIDSNFFYGEFLFNDGDSEDAKGYLLRAKQAPVRLDRPIADKYRRMAIDELLVKIEND